MASDLQRIRRFLTSSSEERQTSDQRRFAYIACISALYSSFENFAEQVAFRFSQMMLADPSNCSEDQMLKLRRRYVRSASALLGQSLGVGRYQGVTELDVAKSLASCLDESHTSIDLRLELIALHNSNLRWESLAEIFHWAMPDLLSKIQYSDSVQKWMSLTPNVSDGTLPVVLKNELDDLVERRNEVAHRAIPDEILSYEHLLAKVSYIEAISLGLIASLAGPLLKAAMKNGTSVSLGIPADYYKSRRVVIISSLKSEISEGDLIFATGDNSTRWGRVLEVQVADERVAHAPEGAEAGLLLDFVAPNKVELNFWQEPIPDLASPPDGIFGSRGPFITA
ncbi:HEPN domain-containing protein [Nocardia sp. NPDC004260]